MRLVGLTCSGAPDKTTYTNLTSNINPQPAFRDTKCFFVLISVYVFLLYSNIFLLNNRWGFRWCLGVQLRGPLEFPLEDC